MSEDVANAKTDELPSGSPLGVHPPGYAAIPVSVARGIGEDYRKDCVVILAYDHASQKTHATTWGREPSDKEGAVRVRDKCVAAIGAGMSDGTVYQDYRREGEAAQTVDRLSAACRAVVDTWDANEWQEHAGDGELSESIAALRDAIQAA